jgi:general secretion pathway protein D
MLFSVFNNRSMRGIWIAAAVLFIASAVSCAGNQASKSSGASQAGADVQQRSSVQSQDIASDTGKTYQKKSSSAPLPVIEEEEQPVSEPYSGPGQKPAYKKRTADKTEPVAAPAGTDKQKIALDFDDADIYEVINALSDILNINYVIDPAVKGKVNIHTSGEIDKSQIFPILETIFKINNITAVKTGNLYKIVPLKDARSTVTDVEVGTEAEVMLSGDRVIIQIVPLRYIPSAEVLKVLKPFISAGGDIQEYSKGNILIIVDTSANINKLLSFIDVMDVDTFENMQVRFYKIKNADVKEMAKELETLFTSMGIAKSDKGIGISFIPVERANYILAVSSIPGILDKVEHWIPMLDSVDTGTEEQVFVYALENAKAEDMAEVLGSIYGEGQGQKTTGKTQTGTRQQQQSTASRTSRSRTARETTSRTKKETGGTGVSSAEGMLEEPIKIVTDEATNSVIIRAIPSDYAVIKQTIERLDRVPRQVLIEVLIAEVTLSGDTEFGVEWALRNPDTSLGGYKGRSRIESTFGLGGLGTSLSDSLNKGYTYRFDSSRLQAFLVAQASQNKLNILSCPSVLAADNKEARIEVGEEVPIVTSEYVPLTAEQVDTTSRSIEYRSTGVILTVTPRINEKGLVAMDISQEVSKAQPVVAGGIQSPVITNRKAETSLVVQNATTIVIGGLIGHESAKTISGVPFFSSIPLLGYLFSDTKDSKKKAELIILITPRVVTNINEAEIVSQEFRNKVEQIKKLIRRSEDKWMEDYKQ